MSMKREILLIAVAFILLAFAGNHLLSVTDPVESNYALTAKEMVTAGEYISPRIYGNYWYDKPIFFYWELIGAFQFLGVNEFAARFFPAVFSLLNLALTGSFACTLYGRKTAMFSVLIFGTTAGFYYLSKAIITDMTFVFFFNAVLISFYVAYHTGRKKVYLLSFFFAALATLTKGPIGILLPGLILLAFLYARRDLKELLHMHLLAGSLIFLFIAGCWYFPMYQLHGNDFVGNFLGVHNFLRATVSEHPRYDVWYYYPVIFLLGFFPWSLTVLYGLKERWKIWKKFCLTDKTLFLLLWAVLVNVFFQLMATKYPTYTLPAFLPLAILTARLLTEHERLIYRLAGGMWAVYMVLTFTAAIPLTNLRSAKDTVTLLRQANPENRLVVSYGAYPASAVYYYGKNIPRLEWAEEIKKDRPDGISWKAKNVMPFLAMEELPVGVPVFVICEGGRVQQLKQEIPEADWVTVKELHRTTVLRLIIPAAPIKRQVEVI